MSITILLAAAGISIACSLLVSAFLSKPLYQLLGDLCGQTSEHASGTATLRSCCCSCRC